MYGMFHASINVSFHLQNALDLKIIEVMIKCLQHSEYEVC